jgi:hypothetical protein
MKRIGIAVLSSLVAVGCASSGLRIVETGFSAVETAPSQFAVKLESAEIRTDEEAEANLLVHAARWTIDHSGVYFTLGDRISGHETGIDVEQASREDSGTGVPTVTQTSTGGYTTAATGKRRATRSMRATLRIYRDKPEGIEETIYEASRVLDRYHQTRTTTGSTPRAGVAARSNP